MIQNEITYLECPTFYYLAPLITLQTRLNQNGIFRVKLAFERWNQFHSFMLRSYLGSLLEDALK